MMTLVTKWGKKGERNFLFVPEDSRDHVAALLTERWKPEVARKTLARQTTRLKDHFHGNTIRKQAVIAPNRRLMI